MLGLLVAYAAAAIEPAQGTNTQSGPGGSIPVEAATNKPLSSEGLPQMKRRTLNGVVTRIDLTNRWVEIRTTNGLEQIAYRTNVNVLLTGQRIPVSEIQVGDRVGLVVRSGNGDGWQILSARIGARPPGGGNVKRTDDSHLPDR